MSVRAAFKVDLSGWDNAHGRPSAARLVLVALAYRSNIEGQAWPSGAALTEDTCLSRATVYRALDGLVAAGLVEVIHRPGRSSIFHVNVSPTETYLSGTETYVAQAETQKYVKEVVKEPYGARTENGFRENTNGRFVHSRDCDCGGSGWLDTWDPAARALIAVPCPDGPQA